jgi:predicted  nucleic acid-binding Zn-ribbon protein
VRPALKKEQEEKTEAEAKLAEYNARLKDVDENRAAVDAELEGLRSRTEKLKLGACALFAWNNCS